MLLSRVSQLLDRRWLHFYLQRRFRSPAVRRWVTDRIAGTRGPRRFVSEGSDGRSARIAADLAESGLARLGTRLDANQCEELRVWFAGKQVIDHYRPDHPPFLPLGEDRHPHCHVANHTAEDVIAAPYLLELANDPVLLAAVGDYLGCDPMISYMTAWWSYPTGIGAQQAENFHRDVDDWRFVKLFVYLTDVGPESGPHVYVRGSARQNQATQLRRYTDDEILDSFGGQSLAVQTARAGEAFLEDTFGFHKGTPVEAGRRLLFQVLYTVTVSPYGPTKPVARFSDRLGADEKLRAVNRIYLA